MLAIRMQRTGRKGLPHYRVVVQDSRRTPRSGRVVAAIGSYDPHSKQASIDKEKAQTYINNGAQPSDRVAVLFKNEGIILPSWVNVRSSNKRTVRNTEKLRKHQPAAEPQAIEEVSTEVAEQNVTA